MLIRFSFAIAIGLILFIAGLVISLTLGDGTSIGLIFGIPLMLAGLVVPLIMMRGQFKQNEVTGVSLLRDADQNFGRDDSDWNVRTASE